MARSVSLVIAALGVLALCQSAYAYQCYYGGPYTDATLSTATLATDSITTYAACYSYTNVTTTSAGKIKWYSFGGDIVNCATYKTAQDALAAAAAALAKNYPPVPPSSITYEDFYNCCEANLCNDKNSAPSSALKALPTFFAAIFAFVAVYLMKH